MRNLKLHMFPFPLFSFIQVDCTFTRRFVDFFYWYFLQVRVNSVETFLNFYLVNLFYWYEFGLFWYNNKCSFEKQLGSTHTQRAYILHALLCWVHTGWTVKMLFCVALLKVSKSRKQIMASWILPKNERWCNFQYTKLPQRLFLGIESRTP